MESCSSATLSYKLFLPASGEDGTLLPVLFLHGITSSKEYWDDIPQIIADRTKRKAYTLDARNHGDSAWSDDFSFDLNAEDLLCFMDSMDIPRAVLIGHSMGGLTSIKAALRKPEKFEKIFIEDIGVRKGSREGLDRIIGSILLSQEAVSQIPPEYEEKEAWKFILQYMRSKVPAHHLPSTATESKYRVPLKRDAEGKYCLKTNTKSILRYLKCSEVMSNCTGSYAGPACFIYGTDSYIQVKAQEELILEHFPKAELVAVEGADHFVHASFPDEFTEAVLQRLLKK